MSMLLPSQMPATALRTVELVTDQLETPLLDDRSYRVIKLDNQLEVLLVHDADTDKASAAMDVNVGSFSDPKDMPGLAHVVEHMLLRGSRKYPGDDAYAKYLSLNSGSCGAYTITTSTNFYFVVAAKPANASGSSEAERSPLYGALDHFSQFFIEPLFLQDTVDRELLTIDAEYKLYLQDDQHRLQQLDKFLTNKNHPYCRFHTGNLETLKTVPEASGINVREKFIEFHEKHYSANRMKLVVLGREPLDVLEEWVADLFARLKNKNLPQNRWEDEKPLGENELRRQYFAKPVSETMTVELLFPFRDEEELYETQPSRYLSHLIGHKGPGSIMAFIDSHGWANELSAGAYPVCPGTPGFFHICVWLTEDGLEHYKEIVKVIFQYISLLCKTSPKEWIFNEQKTMAEIKFKSKQKTPVSEFTRKTSAAMQRPLPREWLISGDIKLRRFDPDGIRTGLSYLRPDNFVLAVASQLFPGDWDQKERWYGTEYKYEEIPVDFLAEIREVYHSGNCLPELHLPDKNPFIPTKLEVEKKEVKEPLIAPKLIRNDDLIRAWFKEEGMMLWKANLFVNCKNPLPSATAENVLKAQVYAELVKDKLEGYSFYAKLAGLKYEISCNLMDIEIRVWGCNEKLHVLLKEVLTAMRDLIPDRFKIVKERLLKDMRNWEYQLPHRQITDYIRWLNSEKGFINSELLAELEQLTAEDIQSFYPQMLRQMHFETLVHGNLDKEDALCLNKLVESTLKPRPLLPAQWPVRRCLVFPPGSNFLYRRALKDPKNVNHCIGYSLYVGDRADRVLRSKILLLDQMTRQKAFNQLLTTERLGYIVWSYSDEFETTMAFQFIIASEKTPEYLEARIDAFLESYESTIQDMSEVEFDAHKKSLITKRLEKLKDNPCQESGRLWSHIDDGYFDFELINHDAEYIGVLTQSNMIEFFRQYIAPSSPARAKLAIHLHAQGISEVSSLIEVTPGEADNAVEHGMNTLVKNVRDLRSHLNVSVAPQPVKPLSEFAEAGDGDRSWK